MKKRRWETKRYQISAQRRGVIQFDDAYDARTAARLATNRARQGWTAEVQAGSGRGVLNRKLITYMRCEPKVGARGKTIAACTMRPAFKKKVKGL